MSLVQYSCYFIMRLRDCSGVYDILVTCSPSAHLAWQDLSKLNRDPAKVLYLSGHALESCLQLENCVPIKPWLQHDRDDTALLDFIPFLECKNFLKICSTLNSGLKLLVQHLLFAKVALPPVFYLQLLPEVVQLI